MEDGHNNSSNDASTEASSPERDTKQSEKKQLGPRTPSGHSRSLSGSLSFLFQRSPEQNTASPTSEPSPAIAAASTAMAMAVNQKSVRKRKGSLRKTALLDGGRRRAEDKERRSNHLNGIVSADPHNASQKESGAPSTPTNSFDLPTPRPISSVPPPVPMVTHPIHGDPSKISAQGNDSQPYSTLQRPMTADSTASTTDEEEFSISATTVGLLPLAKEPQDSYFPPQPRLLPTRTTTPSSHSSPLAALPPTVPFPTPSEWDYSETRWWGWIILVVTWIVFVVGMGSCFEVWSWAWDVGETPYAPPELEDDPTLPIVGYYPALIILTLVMAWVWVTVAGVGMKYFKHANISGDEV